MVFVLDSELRFRSHFCPHEQHLFLAPGQFLGASFDELPFPQATKESIRNALLRTLDTGQQGAARYSLELPRGIQHYELRSAPLSSQSEQGVVCVIKNVSQREAEEHELRLQSQIQTLLTKISTEYIALAPSQLADAISDSLTQLGSFVGADRVYVFDYDWTGKSCRNTYEWCAEGIEPQLELLQCINLADIPDWTQAHARGDMMIVEDVCKLPIDDNVRAILQPQGVQSLLAVPIMGTNECLGFVGFDYVRSRHVASSSERQLLTLFAQMLANVRKRIESELALSTARKSAEAANRAKSEFLANVSHEIRTPMNGVIGMTGLLLDSELSREQRHYAEIVNSSAQSLLALMNDILDFSKIESKKLQLEPHDFDLLTLLNELLVSTEALAPEKGLRVNLDIDAEVPVSLHADSARLRQVLGNLLNNAVKFTAQGEIGVQVGVVLVCNETIHLRFAVTDSGPGIPADKQAFVFEAFSQVDSSSTRRFGGTGLGLAICKQLVELLGGELQLNTELGKGSEFFFTVPLKLRHGHDKPLRGLRLLLLDEPRWQRASLLARLRAWAMQVTAVETPALALQTLQAAAPSQPFVLAMLSCDTTAGGVEQLTNLAQQIRADSALQKLSLLMLGNRPISPERLRERGFQGSLATPFHHEELQALLQLLLHPSSKQAVGKVDLCSSGLAPRPPGVLPWRILLVDDHVTNQQVGLSILRQLGVTANAVANGTEALAALSAQPYDFCFMDVQMPVMDGLEATRRLRVREGLEKRPRLPIVGLSAHASQSDRERCLAAGMDDYLCKPVTTRLVADCLARWLQKNEHRTAAPACPPPDIATRTVQSDFDHQSLARRLLFDQEIICAALRSFVDDMPKQLAQLAACIEGQKWKTLTEHAHRIRGAASTVSADVLSRHAQELERLAKLEDEQGTLRQHQTLRAAYERFLLALSASPFACRRT
jgi:signal transduction histidine kinase/DNA-binding response OmpR family regulator